MPQRFITTLTQEEQRELSLCGVTQDIQLVEADPKRLIAELDLAAKLLSRTARVLTTERLQHICQQAREELGVTLEKPPVRMKQPGDWDNLPLARQESVFRKPQTKGIDRQHTAHPIPLFLAALFLLLLVAATGCLAVFCGYCALFGEVPGSSLLLTLGLYAGLWICYLLSILQARCVICRGTMCSIFTSKRSVHAHYIPLLGHSIPAAFSIIFTFRTICPHCGTLQLLIGGARPRHRSKK